MNYEPQEAPRKNIDFVSYSDQGGRGDGVQIMVHKGHAYIGHMFSNGVTVMDVTDPKNPRPVNFLPTPPNTWSLPSQTHDDSPVSRQCSKYLFSQLSASRKRSTTTNLS